MPLRQTKYRGECPIRSLFRKSGIWHCSRQLEKTKDAFWKYVNENYK